MLPSDWAHTHWQTRRIDRADPHSLCIDEPRSLCTSATNGPTQRFDRCPKFGHHVQCLASPSILGNRGISLPAATRPCKRSHSPLHHAWPAMTYLWGYFSSQIRAGKVWHPSFTILVRTVQDARSAVHPSIHAHDTWSACNFFATARSRSPKRRSSSTIYSGAMCSLVNTWCNNINVRWSQQLHSARFILPKPISAPDIPTRLTKPPMIYNITLRTASQECLTEDCQIFVNTFIFHMTRLLSSLLLHTDLHASEHGCCAISVHDMQLRSDVFR